MKQAQVDELAGRLAGKQPTDHRAIAALLGNDWCGTSVFTYVGPLTNSTAAWPDITRHVVDWLNISVVPEVLRRNQQRVLRAIPAPPSYDLKAILGALWVLESERNSSQGTAFALQGVGLVTCAHAVEEDTCAFQPGAPTKKYAVSVKRSQSVVDLAVLCVEVELSGTLPLGSSEALSQMSHIAVAGFPNYRLGDTGVLVPGLIVGYRPFSGVRRILTNVPIIAGSSGGPVLSSENRVIGVAVTGADSMVEAGETENHGIIPIEALKLL